MMIAAERGAPGPRRRISRSAICAGVLLPALALLFPLAASAQSVDLHIEGARHLSEAEVRRLLSVPSLDSGRIALYEAYLADGFLNVSVQIDSPRVVITEGERFRFDHVSLRPDSAARLVVLSGYDSTAHSGEFFSIGTVERDLGELVALLNEQGYPLAVARLVDLDLRESPARVRPVVELMPGERVVISEVEIQGTVSTKRDLILAAAAIPSDRPFTDQVAAAVRARLMRLNIFTEVQEPKLYRTDSGNYGLLLTVVEGNTNTFDGVLGYQPPDTDDDAGYLTGLVRVLLRNLFGSGRRLSARWQQIDRDSRELEVRYGEPFIFRLPIDVELGFRQRQEEESPARVSYVQSFLSGDAYYGLTEEIQLRLGGSYDVTLPQVDTVDGCSPRQLLNSSLLSTTFGGIYDTRSDRYNPVTGIRYSTSYSVGIKQIRGPFQCLDSTIQGSESRQKIEADLEGYLPLVGPTVGVTALHYGEIRGEALEESDLFYFGGQETVRGYRENEIRASRRLWGTVEARLLLSRTSYAGAFFDIGYYERPEDIRRGIDAFNAWIFGYGIGAQIETPLGLVRLSFALGQDDTFETGKVFVGLINQF